MALICHCCVVSDRHILGHVAEGACTVEEVQEACGAGTRCGGCLRSVEALVNGAVSLASSVPA